MYTVHFILALVWQLQVFNLLFIQNRHIQVSVGCASLHPGIGSQVIPTRQWTHQELLKPASQFSEKSSTTRLIRYDIVDCQAVACFRNPTDEPPSKRNTRRTVANFYDIGAGDYLCTGKAIHMHKGTDLPARTGWR